MRKQWSVAVAWVVLFVLTAGTAQAQGVSPPVEEYSLVQCDGSRTTTIVPYSEAAWRRLTPQEQSIRCASQGQRWTGTVPPTEAFVERPVTITKMRSEKLMIAGGLTALMGFVMIIPQGDNFRFLGDQYCVSDYSVDAGPCTAGSVKFGAMALGAGVVMAMIGMKKVEVQVAPIVSADTKGVTGTVSWGGR